MPAAAAAVVQLHTVAVTTQHIYNSIIIMTRAMNRYEQVKHTSTNRHTLAVANAGTVP
jgi:hypothetical protein